MWQIRQVPLYKITAVACRVGDHLGGHQHRVEDELFVPHMPKEGASQQRIAEICGVTRQRAAASSHPIPPKGELVRFGPPAATHRR